MEVTVMPGPLDFFLNQGEEAEQKQVVEAPAFSLTKVLASGAVIITPLATLLVDKLDKADFRPAHYVALALGLLGFLAIASAADVLARAIGTAAVKKAEAATAGQAQAAANAARLVPFDTPVTALWSLPGPDQQVKVLAAASAGDPYLLVQGDDDKLTWVLAKDVRVGKAKSNDAGDRN
jgi:hypothetical protein